MTGTVNLPYRTTVSLIYWAGRAIRTPGSVNGDANADGINGNDLPFIPANASQISLAPGQSFDALDEFIESQDCLREARGGTAPPQLLPQSLAELPEHAVGGDDSDGRRARDSSCRSTCSTCSTSSIATGDFTSRSANSRTAPRFLNAVGFDAANNRPIYTFAGADHHRDHGVRREPQRRPGRREPVPLDHAARGEVRF